MATWTVAVLGFRVDSLELEQQQLRGHDVAWRLSLGLTKEEILEQAGDADAILAGSLCRLTGDVIEQLHRCRVIARYGIGVDNVDVQAASRRGIWVTNVPDYCIDEVATHTILLLLACHRKLLQALQGPGRTWGIGHLKPIAGLQTQTLGIVGLGQIGQAVARRAMALGLRVLAYDPLVPAERAEQVGVRLVGLEELLRQADYVSLHVPLTEGTRHLIDGRALALMKPGSYLINTARGGLVDEEALRAALDGGHLAGAALDVLEVEPPSQGHPLVGHPKVLLTPHVAWYSERSAREMRIRAAEEVRRVLEGGRPLHPVNYPAQGGKTARGASA